MTAPSGPPARRRAARVLGWLVPAWSVAVLVLTWRWFETSFSFDALSPSEEAAAHRAFLRLAVLLVAGPVVLAVVAVVVGRPRTALVHAVLAVVAVVAVGPSLAREVRDSLPEPPPGPRGCVERSGGDSDCPGG